MGRGKKGRPRRRTYSGHWDLLCERGIPLQRLENEEERSSLVEDRKEVQQNSGDGSEKHSLGLSTIAELPGAAASSVLVISHAAIAL